MWFVETTYINQRAIKIKRKIRYTLTLNIVVASEVNRRQFPDLHVSSPEHCDELKLVKVIEVPDLVTV